MAGRSRSIDGGISQSLGRMDDIKNHTKMMKSILGNCYICRNDFNLSDRFATDIRKIGKRYRKVNFHPNCNN